MKEVLWDKDYARYVSFKRMDLSIQLRMIYSNNMTNIDAKFIVLEGVNIIDIIDYNRVRY